MAPAQGQERFGLFSTDKQVVITSPVGQYGGIENLSAGTALPRIEGSHEIIKFFGVHSSSALGTLHILPL
jgi:hypothetical protein